MLEIAHGEVEGAGEQFVVGGRHDVGLCGVVGRQVVADLIVVSRAAKGRERVSSGSWLAGLGVGKDDLPQGSFAAIAAAGTVGIVFTS